MRIYRKIDKEGYFVEDVVVEPIVVPTTFKDDGEIDKEGYEEYPTMDEYHIEKDVPDGMHKPKWDGTEWVETEDEEVLNNYARIAYLQNIGDEIQGAIFQYYPKSKQDEDKGWKAYWEGYIIGVSHNTTELTSVGMDELVSDVVGATVLVRDKKLTIDKYVASKPKPFRDGYHKLIKISLKYMWLKAMLDEWRLALAEQRTPTYPQFPSL